MARRADLCDIGAPRRSHERRIPARRPHAARSSHSRAVRGRRARAQPHVHVPVRRGQPQGRRARGARRRGSRGRTPLASGVARGGHRGDGPPRGGVEHYRGARRQSALRTHEFSARSGLPAGERGGQARAVQRRHPAALRIPRASARLHGAGRRRLCLRTQLRARWQQRGATHPDGDQLRHCRRFLCGPRRGPARPGSALRRGERVRRRSGAAALAAFAAIVEQGEGAPRDSVGSHYQKFLGIRAELRALTDAKPAFSPAFPAATNPVLRRPARPEGRVWLENPGAVATVDLANASYGLMLRLLAYAYAVRGPSAEKSLTVDLAIGLMQAVMPLTERAARLPAGPSNPQCNAGMSFITLRDAAALPAGPAARRLFVERFAQLAEGATAVRASGDARAAAAADQLAALASRASRGFDLTPGAAARGAPGGAPGGAAAAVAPEAAAAAAAPPSSMSAGVET